MRNGTRFNSTPFRRLTLVGGSKTGSGPDTDDDAAAYFPRQPDSEMLPAQDEGAKSLFYVFLTLSISCAAAAVATGSYAVWLARQEAAHQALTDVNDILRSCQARMSQLEEDVQRLPTRSA